MTNHSQIQFRGVRRNGMTQVRVHGPSPGVVHDLPRRLDVVNHSPSGFEWGYAGSGPAQLALAMLLALGIDRERAAIWHQHIKRDCIQGLQGDEFVIDGDDVLRALAAAEARYADVEGGRRA